MADLDSRFPFPGWPFWVTACVVAPLLAIGTFVGIGFAWPGLVDDGSGPLVICGLLSTTYGALLPRALPHVRAVPLTVRRGWAAVGALVAGISTLPWMFVLLFSALVLFCDGECLS